MKESKIHIDDGSNPGQEVVLGSKFHCVKKGAEAWVMVEQQETKQMEWPAICLTIPAR